MLVFASTKQEGTDHPLTINTEKASETLDFILKLMRKIDREGYRRYEKLKSSLTFASPAVTVRIARFNIQKFYMVLTLCVCARFE
jgi:hypothetical protein